MITARYLARACFGSLNGLNGARSELDIRGLLCNLVEAETSVSHCGIRSYEELEGERGVRTTLVP